MRWNRAFCALVLCGAAAVAQEAKEEVVDYSVPDIEKYLSMFKSDFGKKKVPQEDVIATLQNLVKAHKFLASKGEAATKDDVKLGKKIVKQIAAGLKAKDREMVSYECAKALGTLADPEGQRPLLSWMEDVVLEDKAPPMQSVEAGFLALARIGGTDSATLDVLRAYATGKHTDAAVASGALKAVIEWRQIDANDRKEFFEKILGYLASLYSGMKGGEAKTRGVFEQRYNTVKESGLAALAQLAGDGTTFAEPAAATKWMNDNKKKKWEDYVGVGFRKGATSEAAPAEEAPDEEKKGEGDA